MTTKKTFTGIIKRQLLNLKSMTLDNKKILVFILIAYSFSWTIEIIAINKLDLKFNFSKLLPYLMIAQFGPTISAILTAFSFEKKQGLKNLITSNLKFRFHPTSFLLSLFTIPIIFLLLYLALGIRPKTGFDSILVYLTLIASVLNGFLTSFVGGVGPLGEELGWRGFLLPILQKKYSILIASIVLGLTWTFWHLPIFFFTEWRNGLAIQQFVFLYPISMIMITYFMTIVYLLTRGSIFISIWVHGIFNVVLGYVSNDKIWDHKGKSTLNNYLIILFGLFCCCIVIHLLNEKKIKSIGTANRGIAKSGV